MVVQTFATHLVADITCAKHIHYKIVSSSVHIITSSCYYCRSGNRAVIISSYSPVLKPQVY